MTRRAATVEAIDLNISFTWVQQIDVEMSLALEVFRFHTKDFHTAKTPNSIIFFCLSLRYGMSFTQAFFSTNHTHTLRSPFSFFPLLFFFALSRHDKHGRKIWTSKQQTLTKTTIFFFIKFIKLYNFFSLHKYSCFFCPYSLHYTSMSTACSCSW